jgi:short-subunit dehydrogenase/predicted transcriptional regulator
VSLPTPHEHTTALVTGASSGIGAEVARLLADKGHGVTLVARREDRLAELADEIQSHRHVRAHAIGCDLSDGAARERLFGEIAKRGLEVSILVNNAGFGSAGRFQELDIDDELRMVHTNLAAVLHLCGEYVPAMVGRGEGAVMNVASVAGFQPLPRQATYAASKAFVLSFTETLSSDLKGTGVTATALCPGPVKSEFTDQHAGFESAESTPDFLWMSSEDCAKAAVNGLERGKRVVVPGVGNRVSTLAGQHAPRSLLLAAARRFYPPDTVPPVLISDVMTHAVVSADVADTLRHVGGLMRERNVGSVVICDGGQPVGVITDRDVALAVLADGADPDGAAGDHASQPLVAGDVEMDLEQAADLMVQHHIRRLPLLDGGRLAGIVTIDDVAVRAGDLELAHRVTAEVAKGAIPEFFFHRRGG